MGNGNWAYDHLISPTMMVILDSHRSLARGSLHHGLQWSCLGGGINNEYIADVTVSSFIPVTGLDSTRTLVCSISEEVVMEK